MKIHLTKTWRIWKISQRRNNGQQGQATGSSDLGERGSRCKCRSLTPVNFTSSDIVSDVSRLLASYRQHKLPGEFKIE